jgi:hypothetical protein
MPYWSQTPDNIRVNLSARGTLTHSKQRRRSHAAGYAAR